MKLQWPTSVKNEYVGNPFYVYKLWNASYQFYRPVFITDQQQTTLYSFGGYLSADDYVISFYSGINEYMILLWEFKFRISSWFELNFIAHLRIQSQFTHVICAISLHTNNTEYLSFKPRYKCIYNFPILLNGSNRTHTNAIHGHFLLICTASICVNIWPQTSTTLSHQIYPIMLLLIKY